MDVTVADIAVIPSLGLAPQELPYIQVLADDGNWAESGLAAFGQFAAEADLAVWGERYSKG